MARPSPGFPCYNGCMERLLDYFKPDSYNLELYIFRDRETIEGTAQIFGLLQQDQFAKFHAVNMEILEVTYAPSCDVGYVSESGEQTDNKYDNTPCDFEYDGQTLNIPITPEMHDRLYDPEAIRACKDAYGDDAYIAEVTFFVRFKAKLNHNMQGCYLSTYDWQGQQQKIVATQFESHYAREAFPCIDEPAAKARFSLTLLVPDRTPADVILANTPLSYQDINRFTFETTPRMSTYLLAWVIGPFKSVSTVNQHGVKVTSYAALNQPVESLTFANSTAAKALDYYDEQFGVRYPLPKLDQVALPDFEAGAMENWGLVTYRESMLLADTTATMETKQSVAVTVNHELSHQWFGDLVTMEWWDDLWLNESFATMMEFYCTDALYPEFNVWQDFFTNDCVAALRRDSLPGVQAVQQPVHDPAEIATLFDSAIVYAKGARLMLMLNRLMGQANFLRGLRDYFERHAYNNTVGDDLWAALQPYADFDIKEFMHAWISQPGYPAVQIPETDYSSGDISSKKAYASHDIKQQRFLVDGATDATKWPLPEVKDDMSGHYLLNLSDAGFQAKLERFDQLSMEQKLRLLIDRMFLARTPAVASSSLLDLLPKFAATTSAPVWSILTNIIGDLKLFCPPETPAAQHYHQYLLSTFRSQLESLDYGELTDISAIQLRDALLSIAYYAEDEPILRSLADLYRDDLTQIDPELRTSVLSAKLYFDEATVFPELLEKYQHTADPELRSDLLFVLASLAKQPTHLDQLLALLEQPKIVRPQDHIFLYIYLFRNHRTRARVLDWLINHWSYVEQLTGEKSIEDYPRYAAALIRTPEEAEKFYAFFDTKADVPVLKRALQMAHIEIDARLQLIATDAAAVQQKLKTLAEQE